MLTSCALLAACGGGDDEVAGDEPITAAAIAAVVQEHVDLEPRRITDSTAFDAELGDRATAASLRYTDVSLAVVVAPSSDSPLTCADDSFDECVDDTVDGHEVTIAWQDLEPEEDPGIVYDIDRRDGEGVAVQLGGASITDDPRNLDLGVPLEDLAALVTDPRLSLTTSQGVIALGADVEIEPDGPHETSAPQ